MQHKHNQQLPVSAAQPEHELHQRSLVHVGTATAAAALTALTALTAITAITAITAALTAILTAAAA
jgi:hypothetical protein